MIFINDIDIFCSQYIHVFVTTIKSRVESNIVKNNIFYQK